MPTFDIISSLKVLTPRILFAGWLYPYRTAYHILRSTRPELRGISLWREIIRRANMHIQPQQPEIEEFIFSGPVTGHEKSAYHLTVYTKNGAIRFQALTDDLIQVRQRHDRSFLEAHSYSVNMADQALTRVKIKVQERDEHIELRTAALTVQIDRATGYITISDRSGTVLLQEISGVGYHPSRGFIHWEANVDSQAAIYGLGQKASQLDLAGQRFELWNLDPAGYNRGDDPINMSVPFLTVLSERGAIGLFFDNSYRAWIDLGEENPGRVQYRAAGGEFRLYIMTGTPRSILARYSGLTGRIHLPPIWLLGYHQSRWSYYPDSRVMEIAREFRERALPCDALHLDIHYMDGYRCFTWDRQRFPDPPAMLDSLHKQGFKVVSIIDPGIKVDDEYWVSHEGITRDAFMLFPDGTVFSGPVWPEWAYFPDFTNPEVRAWWGGLYRGLLDDGLDAFWNDMNEAAIITVRTMFDNYVPDEIVHHGDGNPTTHAEIHNVYGMLMTRASTEGLRRLRPNRRPALLTRAGWAGVQRYAFHWTADNGSTWDHLLLSIQMVLNLGFSGIPITGPDVGGFSGKPTPELMARWMSAGAFMPFYRNHSMAHTPPQEPWMFGPEVEAISRKYLELRYQLLPYLYTAIWQASKFGLPVVRSLSFMHPDDPLTYHLDDQFYLGDSMMIAPVVYEGARQRSVYLPEGQWVDFWTHQPYEGKQTLTVSAPLDIVPIFVRAGAVIPSWPVQQYVGEKPVDMLFLDAFMGENEHESFLYEDDGETVEYDLDTMHRVSRLRLQRGLLSWQVEQGSFQPSYKQITVRLIGVEDEPTRVMVKEGQLANWEYDHAGAILTVIFNTQGEFQLAYA